MTDDPIVDEVHRTRARLLAECGGDLERYMNRLQRMEREEQNPIIKSIDDLEARVKTLL